MGILQSASAIYSWQMVGLFFHPLWQDNPLAPPDGSAHVRFPHHKGKAASVSRGDGGFGKKQFFIYRAMVWFEGGMALG